MQGTSTPSLDGSSCPSSSVMCPSCSVLDSRVSKRNITKRANHHVATSGDAGNSLEVGLARKVAPKVGSDGQTAYEKDVKREIKVNTLCKHSE